MAASGKELTDAEARRLQTLLGPHTFRLIVQQPTWHGMPLLNPAQMPLANNRPAPPLGQPATAPTAPASVEKHYVQTRQLGAGAAASPPGQPLVPFNEAMRLARENTRQVAEAQVRLAASGLVSIDTFDQQRKALEYLTGQGKQNVELDKKMSKDAVTLRDAFMGVQKSMAYTVGSSAAMYAELRHFAGAAQPGLWRAMDQSVTLLQTKIGGALLPAFDATIDAIMDAAEWFESLSDGEKKLLAGAVVATPALIGLTHAATALAPAGKMAWTALTALISKMKEMPASAQAAFAGIGVVSTGILALASLASDAKGAEAKREQTLERTGRVSEEELNNIGVFGEIGPTRRRQLVEGSNREKDIAGFRETARKLREKWQNPGFMDRLGAGLGVQTREQDEQRARTLENLADRLQKFPSLQTAAERDWRNQVRHASMRVSAAQQENQPRYSPLNEARKQLQLQILGKNRYEQEILREQRKHREEEIRRLDQLIDQGRKKGYTVYD